MLTGDRTKYVGLIFAGIMWRTTSQIQDVRDAEIWVIDPMRLPRTSRRMAMLTLKRAGPGQNSETRSPAE